VSASEYQSIPLNKIEDFGVHANQYYPLDVEVFKSSLDTELLGLLWNKYWVNTLSQSPLISVSSFRLSHFPTHTMRVEPSVCSIADCRPASETFKGTGLSVQHTSTRPNTEGTGREDGECTQGILLPNSLCIKYSVPLVTEGR